MRKSLIASVLLHGSVAALAAVAIGWGESGEREAVRVQFQVSFSAPPSELVPKPPPPDSSAPEPFEFEQQEIEIELENVELPPVEFERVPPRRALLTAAPSAISNKRLSKPLRVSKPPVPERKPVEPQESPAPPAAHVDAPPVPQSCQPPAYPALARRLGHEGTVKVRLKIDSTGAVTRAHVQESSGSKLLDLAALQAVRSWTFQPASRGGRLVAEELIQPVVFRLN